MKYILIPFVGILTSFFFFPTALAILPFANTKILVAILGLIIAVIENNNPEHQGMITKPIVQLSVFGAAFSLICFIAVVYNGTNDYTYVTYFVSMWVWSMAAYTITRLINKVHGKVTFELISRYLVAVCAGQCIIAMLIENYPWFSNFVNSIFVINDGYFEEGGRLYGIGCALDPAGVRFSVVLVLLAELIVNLKGENKNLQLFFYMTAYTIIVVYGNMIARTTTVGAILGLAYIIVRHLLIKKTSSMVWRWIMILVLVTVPLFTYLYNTNAAIRKDLRFGFEGFFSLVEKGHWETHSNNQLEKMVVWPDNTKTWIIGDGYMLSPDMIDPYYTGNEKGYYYKNTDIGYCRFIFYCGIIGLIAFSFFFIKVTFMCIDLFPKRKLCLLFLLLVNFVVWMKVATDIYLVFAILFFTDADREEERELEEKTVLQIQ